MASNQEIVDYFKENVLGKFVRIEIIDRRVFYGLLECVDNEKNMIIKDAIEEIPMDYVSPLNGKIEVFYNNQFPGEPHVDTSKVPDDKKDYFMQEFGKNKFRVGGVVIMGKHLKNMMIQKMLQFKDYAKILEVQRPMTFVIKVCGFSSLSRSGAPKFVSAFSDCIGCRLQAE